MAWWKEGDIIWSGGLALALDDEDKASCDLRCVRGSLLEDVEVFIRE